MLTFKRLREQLTPEDIKRILSGFGIEPHYENNTYIIYPTCCHNPIGKGSYKLYYYKNTHMFKCYTQCNSMFDIFDLIIKIRYQQGTEISKVESIKLAGFSVNTTEEKELEADTITADLAHIIEITNSDKEEPCNLTPIDISFLDDRYIFDTVGLKPWADEGISFNTMLYYNITYDPIDNCVIIPHYDENGNVVGIRGRYLDEGVENKYKPIVYNQQVLRHPTNATLYGYYQNKKAMEMTHTCIIFEGEKSVLKMDTIYDENNISVAVSGKRISQRHIKLLRDAQVSRIILAFDADYTTLSQAQEKLKEYRELAAPLNNYFDVSVIIDMGGRLGYKDSPIDKGEAVFNELMKERVRI